MTIQARHEEILKRTPRASQTSKVKENPARLTDTEGRREPRARLKGIQGKPPRAVKISQRARASVLNLARTKFSTHRQGRQNQLAVFINIRRISAEVASDDHGRPQHHDEYQGFNPYSCQQTQKQETCEGPRANARPSDPQRPRRPYKEATARNRLQKELPIWSHPY